ncbi:V-type ATP synthase subunit I [Methylobacter luteus]|uniref:V-type ATP synthase subunit I n=1 Tax=Methylobacter luteus TaxID=415 RepID=UPI0004007AC1|nr:V-type ATPase 116kDa subunit family protein [Methylobacter luteus]
MAIVRLKKLTFCSLISEKSFILEELQKLGGVHLIALKDDGSAAAEIAYSKLVENVGKALKYLKRCAYKRLQVHDAENFDLDSVVKAVLDIQADRRKLFDKRDALLKRIQEIEPWGDFRLPEEELMRGLKLWFYIVPEQLMKRMWAVDLIWQVVHKDNLYSYIVVIADQEPSASIMPVARTHAGKVPLSRLKSQLNHIELTLQDLQAERESLTRWIDLIEANLDEVADKCNLLVAHSLTLDRDDIFIIQAWAPETELATFGQFAIQHQLALVAADPEAGEMPPTLLKNPESLAGGQEIISFYQTPGYFDWDPSVAVFFSFALFFAMILSDAGYAGLFMLLLAGKWRALGQSEAGLRLRMLAVVTLGAALIWGIIVGSYFGYSPRPDSVWGTLKLLDLNDFDAMMRLSIFVGVVHIALANIVMAYQRRSKRTALAPLGWLAVVIGGFLVWQASNQQNDTVQQIGYGALAAGGLCLLMFSSERAIVKPLDWFWVFLDGLKSLTGLTEIFGNVLSYLRLFALGLAGASLALTFNRFAEQAYHAVPGVGLLLSILILLFGHFLNLALCLMSGVLHGLRLNFIEFYKWSVSDEGYPFKPFSKKGVYRD